MQDLENKKELNEETAETVTGGGDLPPVFDPGSPSLSNQEASEPSIPSYPPLGH